MTTPSPFAVGKAVSDVTGEFASQRRDKSVLDPIIKQALSTNDRNVMNNLLGQVIQNVENPALRKEVTTAFQTKVKQLAEEEKQEKQFQQKQQAQTLTPEQRTKFKDAGFKEQEIDLFEQSPVGGRTEIVKNALDRIQRETPSPTFKQTEDINQILKNQDEGLNSKDRAKAKLKRLDKNTGEISKLRKKIHASKIEGAQLDVLDKLNNTGELPTNLQKVNLNPDGSIKFPGLAGIHAELFQKTINDFLRNIKESFGAKITDFDIKSFMRKLPSLWNSEDGRRAIIRQLKIINELNVLENQGVVDAFKDHGGGRNVDLDSALTIADIKTRERSEELLKKYTDIEDIIGGDLVKVKGGTVPANQLEAFLKAGGQRE